MKNDNKYTKLFDQVSKKYSTCSGIYNRHKNQCLFLYELLGENFALYEELEDAIKYLNISYCPGDAEECHYVLARYRVRLYIDKLFKST